MSVEHLKSEFGTLRQDVDQFYLELATTWNKLDEFSARLAELVKGSSRDQSELAEAFGQARAGFQMVADGLLNVCHAIDNYASGL